MKLFGFLALAASTLLAQTPVPAPTLPGGGQPPPEKAPSPAAPAFRGTPANSPAPVATPATTRELKPAPPEPQTSIDALSPAEVQQALTVIKSTYLRPEALSDAAMSRATLQGLMDRLSPGVLLVAPAAAAKPSAFRSEVLAGTIGYVRLGDLAPPNVAELDAALKKFAGQPAVKSVILDLRATPSANAYEPAAEVSKRFCPKGRLLFTLKKAAAKPERLYTANLDPAFRGLLVVVVDAETAGAGEVIAAVLRAQTNALVVGEKTKGEGVEFAEIPLHGKVLRVADAEVSLSGGESIYPEGVKPDVEIAMSAETKREVLAAELEKGVVTFITDIPRPHMNESALVQGQNPEIDALEAAQRNPERKPPLRDVQLQRAVDLVTTISIYESKPAGR